MVEVVQCQSCGESVQVSNAEDPLHYVTRDANDHDPQTFLIVGGRSGTDRLLHRCAIEDET